MLTRKEVRKRVEKHFPKFGKCQVTGDTGMPLVEYKGTYMIEAAKRQRQRADYRPTAQELYEEWKEDFDEWTSGV